MFQQTVKYKTTWMHPLFELWHLISLITIRKKDLCNFCRTCMMYAARGWTDHCFLKYGLSIIFCPYALRQPSVRGADVSKFKEDGVITTFQT